MAVQLSLHPYIENNPMPSDEPKSDRCAAKCRNGGYCTQYPVTGSERCRMHGGTNPGAPDGNGNAETHGLTADAETWFERHRDDCEDDVREMVAAWMELAPFGWEVTGNVKMLTNAAINECQIEYGDQYISREGVIVQEPVSAGETVFQKDAENSAFLFKDRLQRTTLRILDKLNILDSPASRQADALEGGLDLTLSSEDKDALEDAFDPE